MVGISVFCDQHMNMRIAEQKGYGISVPIQKLTPEKLKLAINKVLGNSRSAFSVTLNNVFP